MDNGPDPLVNHDFFLFNAQSLNIETIDHIVSEHLSESLRFLCITETWCREETIGEVFFPGFSLLCHFSRLKHSRGGVAVWYENTTNAESIELSEYCIELDIEILGFTWCLTGPKKTIVFVCYRSPNGNFDNFIANLHSIFERFVDIKSTVLLMGDFNESSMSKGQLRDFRDFVQCYGLGPRVSEATRVCATTENTLDQIYSNIVGDSCCILDTMVSDHKVVLYNSDCYSHKFKKPNFINKRLFTKSSVDLFLNALGSETWTDVLRASDTESKFDLFYETFLRHFCYFFPVRRVQCRGETGRGWVTHEVKTSSVNLKNMHKLKLKFPVLATQYGKMKTSHNRLVLNSKKSYYSDKILNSDNITKTTWKVISEVTGKSASGSHTNLKLDCEGRVVECPYALANYFNDFFVRAPQLIRGGIPHLNGDNDVVTRPLAHSMFVRDVCEGDVLRLIRHKLKSGSAPGSDDVPSFIVKIAAPFILTPLAEIINSSFSEGVFPSKLKSSVVIPIPKKGSKNL